VHLLAMAYVVVVALVAIAYYLWYLTWPVAEGKVENVSCIVVPSIFFRDRKYRIVRYSYHFDGEEHSVSRQSLFTKRGLSANVKIGDRMPISVCIDLPMLTCPRRPLLDGFVLLVIVLFCSFGAVMAYMKHLGAY
jgi:hypothetical protein